MGYGVGETTLVITDVTVVGTDDGSLTAAQDVVVSGDTITAIGAAGGPVPDGAEMVDGSGRFLVPGLIDMHTHPFNKADPTDDLALLLVHGVTGIRQMSGTDALLADRGGWRTGSPTLSPALLATCGPLLSPMNAGTPEAAVAEVGRQQRAGADFIKVVGVSPDAYRAAQAEANRLGIPTAGHLPVGIDAHEAARAGLGCIEHLGPGVAVFAAASTAESAVTAAANAGPGVRFPGVRPPRNRLVAAAADKIIGVLIARLVVNPSLTTSAQSLSTMRQALDTFDEGKARALAREFVANGTWHCPTLIRVKAQQLCDEPDFAADPDLRFMKSATIRRWTKVARRFNQRFSAEQHETFAREYALQLRLTKIFDEEGVSMLAGTDCVGAVWVVPGASLHDEFTELAAAGLSPLRILQLATLDPARFLGRTDLGTVETGKRADLLLLDANPLDDSAHLRRIAGLVHDGRYRSGVELRRRTEELAARGVA